MAKSQLRQTKQTYLIITLQSWEISIKLTNIGHKR